MAKKRIIYRLVFLGLTILIIPLLPIAIIFLGIGNPEYVIYGTLNMDVSHKASTWEIYTTFLKHIMMFDFGTSTASGQLVIKEIGNAWGESVKSIVPAMFFSYAIGTIIGIYVAKFHVIKELWRKGSFFFYVPMIVFSYVCLYILDVIGIDILSNIKYVFTSLILSIYPVYIVSKSFSKTISEIASSDFFVFHLSCGFNNKEIWKIFCKKFIFIDYLSFFENVVIYMFGFIFFVETPFGIHGIGHKFVFAIHRFDYPVIIGFCIFSIILLSIIGILIEMLRLRLDPRTINE